MKSPMPNIVMPYDPENNKLSKKEFVEKMERLKKKQEYLEKVAEEFDSNYGKPKSEKELKIKELEKQLDKAIKEAQDAEFNAKSEKDEREVLRLKKRVADINKQIAALKG